MSEDWLGGDPFADADDPAAREREQRRREREERRRQREAKQGEEAATPTPSPPEVSPPPPPSPPRTSEQEFWDEDPVAEGPESAPPAPKSAQQPVFHAPAGGNGRPPGPGGRRHPLGALRRHPFRVFAALAALFLAWFLFALFQPFHGDGSGRVVVAVPKGASVSEVGDLLGEKGVIDSSTMFQLRVTIAGKRSELYPGRYTLAEGMSYGAAIDALSQPPVKRTTTVTVPEGYSRAQAAQLVEELGLKGDYTAETVRSPYLDPAKYGGKDAKDLEGFLFPDTFEMKPAAPVADLVQLQLQDFKRRIKGVDMGYARSKNLTTYDVLIIASLVEDEAGVPGQRKQVAAVVYNRLHEGMPLGIDATIRFATGNYTEPLTESELAVDSPYNTRLNAGLPPGPINSPGLDAIEAAAHPARSDYLFYVNQPGTCGKLAFSTTEAEFEADVARYNAAREAAGGNEPDTCGE
ncbi:MAG TPA: endolytic transglycosylase MltG [Solirubrobacterales bacterium]|nr:endolytic transglycosylase MltG [Solirubrobacterales bacterium]